MKISKVSVSDKLNNINTLKNIKNSSMTPAYMQKNAAEIFKYYMGRDMISFGSRPFQETLKKNYFCLPAQFQPDMFQIDAGKALNEGKDVLVEAPTGTGKTAIAHYAASRNIDEGKKTFYTTPLKALSNQKLNEFRAVYGDDKVGILTGDRRENIDAPIVIMTTEVYRNMALSNLYGEENPLMENLGTVIFDEFHYLGDDSRGPVWEESIMLTPKNVQVLGLSATIGNPKDMAKWQSQLKGEDISLVSIPSSARAVPLRFDSIPTSSYIEEEKRLQKRGTVNVNYDNYMPSKPKPSDFKPLVKMLNADKKIPAIIFVFSRRYSRELLEYLSSKGEDLTSESEKKEIERILTKYNADRYIGSDLDINALKKGYAIHNAGIIPAQKEMIEELFQKKLTKVVIATETLAAGINMPAKTVVISSPYKPSDTDDTDEENPTRLLTSNEFKQMAGRAGRRGIDTQGYVYTMPIDKKTEMDFFSLEVCAANPLESAYKPDYAFLSGYFDHNVDSAKLKEFIGKSFYVYSADSEQKTSKYNELVDLSRKKTRILVKRGFLENNSGTYSATLKGKMASAVRGYDAIALTEVIADKKFEGITPEALAAVAGAIANPAQSDDDNFAVGTNVSSIFDSAADNLDTVMENINKSLTSKFKKLGRDIITFNSYQEMIDFIGKIEKPDIEEDAMAEELNRLGALRAKMYTIIRDSGKMTPQQVAEALRKRETVPTKVLQENLDAVEQYKKRINTRTIEDYIQKLQADVAYITSGDKAKKAKARDDKKAEKIRKDIETAQAMKYLDNNIAHALASNDRFLRENPPSKVRRDYDEAERIWIKLTSKDTILSKIQAIMGLEQYLRKHNVSDENEANQNKVTACINALVNKMSGVTNDENAEGIASKPEKYGQLGAKIMYNWALMNRANPYSMSNWKQLLRILSSDRIDEGSIYRGVLQTADLLGQIREMADIGYKNADNENDKEYYLKLRKCSTTARNSIIRYPIEM